jgi:AcrR family transcriptional regulator
MVIEGMEKAGSMMTISGVAKEVGISNASIHNRYSDLADRIRESGGVMKGKDAKTQLAKRLGTIKEEKDKRIRLRNELEEVKALLQKTDSVNAAFQLENARLKAMNKKYLVDLNRLKGGLVKL